ncbi:MAG: hypothetical protein PVI11_07565 [Candidatus Aminicenantes bacterium]
MKPCKVVYWNNPLSPQEELVIFYRFPSNRRSKKSFRTLAAILGSSVQRVRYLEKRAAIKILKTNSIKYKGLKKRIYDTLSAEHPDTRARWKDVYIRQYEKDEGIPRDFQKQY